MISSSISLWSNIIQKTASDGKGEKLNGNWNKNQKMTNLIKWQQIQFRIIKVRQSTKLTDLKNWQKIVFRKIKVRQYTNLTLNVANLDEKPYERWEMFFQDFLFQEILTMTTLTNNRKKQKRKQLSLR